MRLKPEKVSNRKSGLKPRFWRSKTVPSITEILYNLASFLFDAAVAYSQTDEGKLHVEVMLEGLGLGGLTPTRTSETVKADIAAKKNKFGVPAQ
jgi:hypothetical protein